MIETETPEAEEPAFSELAESKKADELSLKLRTKLAWDDVSGDWYAFQDGYWQVVTPKSALSIIKHDLDIVMSSGYSLNTLRNMASFQQISLVITQWNTDKNLLPMKNGVLNLTTMELDEVNAPANKFCWRLPYEYNREAKCPTIFAWLKKTTGDDRETIQMLRASMRFSITGAGDLQRFMELMGPGGTGKSTFIRLIEALVGAGNHVTTDLKNLESNRFETAVLYGKRVAFINDSSRYGGEVSTLKAATGGDPLRMEKKNAQQGQSFLANCFIFIASNEPIQSTDYSSGLSRRRVPVHFEKQVTEKDKAQWREQGGIEAVMKSELPGLLNWVLAMSRNEAVAALGGINATLTKSQRQHLVETNKLAAWVDDNCVLDPNAQTWTGSVPKSSLFAEDKIAEAEVKLFTNYYFWCEENGIKNLSVQRFGNALNELLVSTLKEPVKHMERDKDGRSFLGIALRTDDHADKPTPVTQTYLVQPDKPVIHTPIEMCTEVADYII